MVSSNLLYELSFNKYALKLVLLVKQRITQLRDGFFFLLLAGDSKMLIKGNRHVKDVGIRKPLFSIAMSKHTI